MTLLIAPDSFKGTYSAREVAAAIAAGAGDADPCPVADGGEGTLDAILAAHGGQIHAVQVRDPLGRTVSAELGFIAGGEVAVVEMAAAGGLGLVAPHERDAEAASTFGVGELIALAVDSGVRQVVVTVGRQRDDRRRRGRDRGDRGARRHPRRRADRRH